MSEKISAQGNAMCPCLAQLALSSDNQSYRFQLAASIGMADLRQAYLSFFIIFGFVCLFLSLFRVGKVCVCGGGGGGGGKGGVPRFFLLLVLVPVGLVLYVFLIFFEFRTFN